VHQRLLKITFHVSTDGLRAQRKKNKYLNSVRWVNTNVDDFTTVGHFESQVIFKAFLTPEE
jgi:hypothetical protein